MLFSKHKRRRVDSVFACKDASLRQHNKLE